MQNCKHSQLRTRPSARSTNASKRMPQQIPKSDLADAQQPPLPERLDRYRKRVDQALINYLPPTKNAVTRLQSAMVYATTNGGKRIRPILTYATGNALQLNLEQLDIPACAVELMHAYSLVHDDLPAMDNDDLRRGKPTVHRQYDEATAILAGDALQALAFTLLANYPDSRVTAETRLNMIVILGNASGIGGMAEGQAIDLESVGHDLSLTQLEDMHRHKTGALIRASVLSAAVLAGVSEDVRTRLADYADAIGLAFQIVDDILDIVSDTETLGKPQGADIALNKPTYPALLGLDGARLHAQAMHEKALESLEDLGPAFTELREISALIVNRSH